MSHQVICFDVNQFKEHESEPVHRLALPSYALVEYTQAFKECVLKNRQLLLEHNLQEVVVKTTIVNWFYDLHERFHYGVDSFLHITARKIAFAGTMSPQVEAHFITPYVDIEEVILDDTEVVSLSRNTQYLPFVLSLIKELESKTERYEELSELYWKLEEVKEPLKNLDEACINKLSLDADSALTKVIEESNQLDAQVQALELETEQLLQRIIYKAFNVGFGDFISYAESDKGIVTTLRFEGCYYHGGRICFRGVGITKAGKVGKRDASFYLSLMATP